MPQQALYLKWRPSLFDELVGQEHITRTLRNSLKTGRVRHAYLFSGPRGTGKTTTARLLAKAVNCQHPDPETRPDNTCGICTAINEGRFLDLIEIDAASHTGVDDVRDLRDKIAFAPTEGQYKVYIIDEVHRFSGNAFDALLKTLEEPPDHAIFVLATTEIDKVPPTIKSRCLQFEFRRLSLGEVADRLELITQSEGVNIDRGALELIARQGTGSLRDSISLLDQIIADPSEHITLEIAQRILGTASMRAVRELMNALVANDIAEGLRVINTAIDSGADPRQFGQQVVEHLRAVLLTQTAGAELLEASLEDRDMFAQQAQKIGRGTLLRAIRIFNEAVNTSRGGWQPQLGLELALIDSVRGVLDEEQPEPQPARPARAAEMPAAMPEPEPQAEATLPGSPPVVPLVAVREQWDKMLRVLYKLNQTAPDVVANFRAHRVDGNVVYLSTDNQVFFDRLQDTRKIGIVEQALHNVHRVPLRVKVVLVTTAEHEAGFTETSQRVPSNDPLLSTMRELGGEIRVSQEHD